MKIIGISPEKPYWLNPIISWWNVTPSGHIYSSSLFRRTLKHFVPTPADPWPPVNTSTPAPSSDVASSVSYTLTSDEPSDAASASAVPWVTAHPSDIASGTYNKAAPIDPADWPSVLFDKVRTEYVLTIFLGKYRLYSILTFHFMSLLLQQGWVPVLGCLLVLLERGQWAMMDLLFNLTSKETCLGGYFRTVCSVDVWG